MHHKTLLCFEHLGERLKKGKIFRNPEIPRKHISTASVYQTSTSSVLLLTFNIKNQAK